jgi:hypothetical protein
MSTEVFASEITMGCDGHHKIIHFVSHRKYGCIAAGDFAPIPVQSTERSKKTAAAMTVDG